MADHIPFLYSTKDCELLSEFYKDSPIVRLSLDTVDRVSSRLPNGSRVWVDPAIDGLDDWPRLDRSQSQGKTIPYSRHIARFQGHDKIGDPEFQKKPDRAGVGKFVEAVLDHCLNLGNVNWLSIPQLPIPKGSGRNKINQVLAEATRTWRADRKFSGKLILPVILTHQDQVNGKTQRNAPISLARKCYESAGADGVWVAESTLSDWEGSKTYERRFSGLVAFHLELNKCLPPGAITLAGPYWGMNLVLWARGLVQFPAIGLGSSYQYRVPGFVPWKSRERIAVPPSGDGS